MKLYTEEYLNNLFWKTSNYDLPGCGIYQLALLVDDFEINSFQKLQNMLTDWCAVLLHTGCGRSGFLCECATGRHDRIHLSVHRGAHRVQVSKTCHSRSLFWTPTCLARSLYEVYLLCNSLYLMFIPSLARPPFFYGHFQLKN